VTAEAPCSGTGDVAIPGYDLLERIGEGGMGTVYRARQLSLQRTVAVKVLHSTAGARTAQDFQRESRLLAALSHPDIVAIYDCGWSGDRYFLVTEFVNGAPLRSLMSPGCPWPADRAGVLLAHIAEALTYIHQHGVLHLDLKPENVLCTPSGDVKIADFGLALERIAASARAEQGLVQGTIDYCAPEQRYGLGADERSDLFSLGVIAYELLTGALPSRLYHSARDFNPRLPPGVDGVLCQALARRPEQRQASVAEFNRQLQTSLGRRAVPWLLGRVLFGAGIVLLVGLSLSLGRARQPVVHPGVTLPEVELPQTWWIHDDANPDPVGDRPDLAIPLWVQGPVPTSAEALPLPAWPKPRPVLFHSTERLQIFVHPLLDTGLTTWAASRWQELADLPAVKPEGNFIRAGSFEGLNGFQVSNPWRNDAPNAAPRPGCQVGFGGDEAGNQVLCLVKEESADPSLRVGVWQWLAHAPERPGAVTVLRFRARAQAGSARLLVNPRLPLAIPQADQGPAAEHMRGLAPRHHYQYPQPNTDFYDFRLIDWVQPGPSWRTYLLVWDWPPFATLSHHRRLEIACVGTGEIYLDDVELFTWDQGAVR
jgi:serine/threonine protein kinase